MRKVNWMRCVVIAGLALASVAASSQGGKWKHEIIYDNFFRTDGIAAVNKDGIPTYTVYEDIPGVANQLPQVYRYKTNLTQAAFPGLSQGFTRFINDGGQVAWEGWTPDSLHSMVDAHDYARDAYPGGLPPANHDLGIKGLDANGLPLTTVGTIGEYGRVFHGAEEVYKGFGLSHMNGVMNRRGDITLQALSSLTPRETDLFHNGVNWSAPILGANRYAFPFPSVNDSNDVLWTGDGDNTGGEPWLFLNDRFYARSFLPELPQAVALRITNSGHIAWLARGSREAYLQVDMVDYSYVEGKANRFSTSEFSVFLDEAGHVAWLGHYLGARDAAIIRNHTDISTDVLGTRDIFKDQLWLSGIDEAGNVLWWGAGPNTNHRHEAFVNTFNLSHDFLGDRDYLNAAAAAFGPNGHVLWSVQWRNGLNSFVLSTPVPEPSTAATLSLFLLLRRKRAGRSGPAHP